MDAWMHITIAEMQNYATARMFCCMVRPSVTQIIFPLSDQQNIIKQRILEAEAGKVEHNFLCAHCYILAIIRCAVGVVISCPTYTSFVDGGKKTDFHDT